MVPPDNFYGLPLDKRLELSLRSPAPFYVTGEDNIELAAGNSAAGVTLTLAGRFMQLDGQVTPFAHALIPTTNRVVTTVANALGDGWILNATVFASGGTPLIGQCWARVRVVRGFGGAMAVLGTLVSGYVTAAQSIAFPSGAARGTLDGPGVIRSVAGTNPAPGLEISETVPSGARWRLLALQVLFTADATVANRNPTVVIDDGATILFTSDAAASIVASQQWRLVAACGLQRAPAVSTTFFWGLGATMILLAGWRLRTVTTGLQAGDDFAAPQLLVEEWIEGA